MIPGRQNSKRMIVGMWMTRDVVTIGPQTPIAEAAATMALRRVRRLPVIEANSGSLLLGLVSASDILHAFPPDVNPFAVVPPDARLNPATAADIMSQSLVTATPETPIEEAARLMAGKKIGALPVVRDRKLVGLITESDIFRAFISLFAPPDHGARITFDMSQGEDVFTLISGEARRRHLRVASLISTRQDDLPVCVVHLSGPGVERFLEDLWSSGHRVLSVIRFP